MTYSLHIEPHPDEQLNRQKFKRLTRGGREAAEDAAIAAYLQALEEGKNREEAEQIHTETYNKFLRP